MLRIGLRPARQAEDLPGLPPWLGRLLSARGIQTEEEARRFLHPSLDQLHPPLSLQGMEKAVRILRNARETGKKAAIYGDYDVDGVCASAILHEVFGRMGLPCRVYLPDRHTEGYGLNIPAVEALARECQVLVTVDCGITGAAEVRRAKELGMAVIVTDHHRHGDELPPGDAVVTPLLGDYPFPFLCGAGVAWKLALALLGQDAMDLMELAALATVADLVPLTGENRVIVKLGLECLAETARPGLRALMEKAGVSGGVTSDQVAFQIAPRMNACGRLASARIALEMLLTRDARRGQALALQMESLNQQRKDQETKVQQEAQAQVEQMDLVSTHAIVVSGENWNSGVVGLAAGRIAEKYAYPTVALAREGEVCVGSARSAGDIDIYAALSQCADLFDRFGGHRQAAGLTMRASHLEEFAHRLSRAVEEQTGGVPPMPEILCDGEMALGQVTEETVGWLDRMAPYGMGNPAPRFLCRPVSALSLRAVGAQGKHLKCMFQQGNDLRGGVLFGGGHLAGQTAGEYALVMTPVLNEFRGSVSAECRLYAMELQPETLPPDPNREALCLLRALGTEETARPLAPAALDDLLSGGQGTLLVCRCRETALAMRARFPQADFCLDKADDPRAYHTVLLYGGAADTCASYRHVVLCDGDLGDAAAFGDACPAAAVHALPRTAAVKRLLASLFVDQEGLRGCYQRLRSHIPRDLQDCAEEAHLTVGQGAFALTVFSQIGLMEVCLSPFRASLLPMVKRGPEESALFCMARQAKEEMNGLYGV